MIITIPIDIDEEYFNKFVVADYERKIEDRIYKDIKKALEDKSGYYCRQASMGILMMVEEQIDNTLKEYRDEIIDKAADRLAEKLVKTKKGKEILESQEVVYAKVDAGI